MISNLVQDQEQEPNAQPEPAKPPVQEQIELKVDVSEEEAKNVGVIPEDDPPIRQIMPVNHRQQAEAGDLDVNCAVYNSYLGQCVASILDFLRREDDDLSDKLHLFNNIIHRRWAINF